MPNAEHTPTPWEFVPSTEHHGPYITSEFGNTLADCYAMSNPNSLSVRNGGTSEPIHFMDADANAAFIVRACNSHDRLVAALREVTETYWGVDDDHAGDGGDPPSMIIEARAALKFAETKS